MKQSNECKRKALKRCKFSQTDYWYCFQDKTGQEYLLFGDGSSYSERTRGRKTEVTTTTEGKERKGMKGRKMLLRRSFI